MLSTVLDTFHKYRKQAHQGDGQVSFGGLYETLVIADSELEVQGKRIRRFAGLVATRLRNFPACLVWTPGYVAGNFRNGLDVAGADRLL